MANPIAGDVIRFSTNPAYQGGGNTQAAPFTNAAGVVGDPASVIFAYQVALSAVQAYTAPYLTAPVLLTFGSSVIVRDGAGLYHADIDTTGLAGFWTVIIAGQGNGYQCRTQVTLTVDPSALSVFGT